MVSYSKTKFPVTINAEYTFKQPVEGIASITITKNDGGTIKRNITCNSKSTVFYIDIVKDLGHTISGHYSASINLVFIDPKTNTKVEDFAQVSIIPYTFMLKITADRFYAPGRSVYYTVISKTLEGKPAPNVEVTVTIDGKQSIVKTGSDGTIETRYKSLLTNTPNLYIEVSCTLCTGSGIPLQAIGVKPARGLSLTLLNEK
jgi:hypothetical protein